MSRTTSFLSLLIALFLFTACQKESTVSGQIKGAENMTVHFDQVKIDKSVQPYGQATLDAEGNFNMVVPSNLESGIYQLRIGVKNIDMILDGSESQVVVNANLNTIVTMDYSVSGSKDSEEYVSMMQRFMKKEIDANSMTKYIKEEASPLAGMMLAMKIFKARPNYADIHRAVLDRMHKTDLVDKPLAIQYGSMVSMLESKRKSLQRSSTIKVGQAAPEIALKDPYGKEYKLSDLKGKVVLVDFWAAWCKPCRAENPHLVKVYNEYQDKGFTVFSVSLDGLDTQSKRRFNDDASKIKAGLAKTRQDWAAAIEEDNLTWDYHVSDLKRWESIPVAEYGVGIIPQTFLLDRDGKVAALNPGRDLEEELKKLI